MYGWPGIKRRLAENDDVLLMLLTDCGAALALNVDVVLALDDAWSCFNYKDASDRLSWQCTLDG